MPSPDSERCRESYTSAESEPLLVELTRRNCLLLNERTAALAARDQEVRELKQAIRTLTRRVQNADKLAAEWQQRANELGTEVEVLRDKDAANERRIRALTEEVGSARVALQAQAERAERAESQVDDWYADERERLIEATGCSTPTA